MRQINEAAHLARLREFAGEVLTADLTESELVINYTHGDSLRFEDLRGGVSGEASRIAAVLMAEAMGITEWKDRRALIYIATHCCRVTLGRTGENRRVILAAARHFNQ